MNWCIQITQHGSRAVIADFGLTKIKAGESLNTFCGSPAWTAPEVLEGKNYNESADIYRYFVFLFLHLHLFLNFTLFYLVLVLYSGRYLQDKFLTELWQQIQ